ncbi:MAG: hypothetical protein ACRDHZ_20020 [Ktedonobacteraceae bacterium]
MALVIQESYRQDRKTLIETIQSDLTARLEEQRLPREKAQELNGIFVCLDGKR